MSNNTDDAVTSTTNDKNPWSWLGLLKWSLAYSDGTSPTSASPMSPEDKAFLEMVMKEGIIDENERMKEILKDVTENLEGLRTDTTTTNTSAVEDHVQELLQELRDIVEQIDYARAFAAMKGLPFLLGCVSQKEIPKSIRSSCLGVLATLASNNPPIQKELLEMGAIKTLNELFDQQSTATNQIDDNFRARIIQALSAAVRSHELAEGVFCGVEQSRHVILEGLHGSDVLQKRSLFFLRALITSDAATRERVRWFAHAVAYTADHLAVVPPQHDNNNVISLDVREMALGLLTQLLEQGKSVNTVLDRKDSLVAAGVQRVAALRALTGEECELASVELELWETLLVQLARAVRDVDEPVQPNPAVAPQ